jgi:hypothetical protein
MWISYVEESDRYNFKALLPYEYDLLVDEDVGEVRAFVITHLKEDHVGDICKEYSIWSDETFIKLRCDTKGNIKGVVTEKANPAGRVPIAYCAYEKTVGYPEENNIANQSLSWALAYTENKTSGKIQGISNLVVEHDESQRIDKVEIGKSDVIALPQRSEDASLGIKGAQTKAYWINANPKLSEVHSNLRDEAVEILDEHGISAASKSDGAKSVSSAISKIVDDADVQSIIEENQGLYTETLEPMVYQVLRGFENWKNSQFLRSDKISVIYPKPKLLLTDKEKLENIGLMEQLRLIEPHEKHQKLNPNLSETEAKEKEARIKEAYISKKEIVNADNPERN